MRFTLKVATTVAGVLTLIVTSAPTAAAATPRNGVCESGEVCFYYLDNRTGSVSDFDDSLRRYGATQPTCYEFRGPGAGQGQCMRRNARSVWNRMRWPVAVYVEDNFEGQSDMAYGDTVHLLRTYDNNASHQVIR